MSSYKPHRGFSIPTIEELWYSTDDPDLYLDEGEDEMTEETVLKKLSTLKDEQKKILDLVFKNQRINVSVDELLSCSEVPPEADTKVLAELEELREENKRLLSEAYKPLFEVKEKKTGDIPEGKLVWKPVKELFECMGSYDFEVPCWEWDGVHPNVPDIKKNYIFREELLLPALYSLIHNDRTWLVGPTGSGKTTLPEQIAAVTNTPFGRLNLDSNLERQDMVGKVDLKSGEKGVETVWVDGLLPNLLKGPNIIVFDEMSCVRPDVAYVLQSILEGGVLRILEDNGREVEPHPMARMFATDNTNGQGDEFGIYQGTRPQSAAFLNRFTTWIKVPYLSGKDTMDLITNEVPSLSASNVKILSDYVIEHQKLFENVEVSTPISPRTFLSVANKAVFYDVVMVGPKVDSLKKALQDTIISSCNREDANALQGLIDRIIK